MSESAVVGIDRTEPTRGAWPQTLRIGRRAAIRWDVAALAVGTFAAAVAVVVTLGADFLAHPGWLALQKADLILGPIGVGVYWLRRRPASRFGVVLIAVGLLHIPYVAESSANATIFTVGYYWEGVVYVCTYLLILTFPSGRVRWFPEGLLLAFATLGPAAISTASAALFSEASPGGSISACRDACPRNMLVVADDPQLALRLIPYAKWATIGLASATAALLVWRLVHGSPPRRRAFAIATPIALTFLGAQVLYQLAQMYATPSGEFLDVVRWTIAIARSLVWYGFLFALIVAELSAARVLRRMVRESLRRPTLAELEQLLRRPLGDPRLRLAFRQPRTQAWVDGDGRPVEPPAPGSGQMLTEVRRDGRPAAAIIHDTQLADDPELLLSAGATVLLARENALLHEAWARSLADLHESRARVATAGDRERRKLERDLHDGAQQGLLATRIGLMLAAERAPAELRRDLDRLVGTLDGALDELRDLAHGIYPTQLAEHGLVAALMAAAVPAGRSVEISADGAGRYPTEIEAAVYYCCREAVQNAFKHAGPAARVTVRLAADGERLMFEVSDDGAGFDPDARSGTGLDNLRDRIAIVGGSVDISSARGVGTRVAGVVPIGDGARGQTEGPP